MGYDFMLFRLRRRVAPCPAPFPDDTDRDFFVAIDDPAPLHEAIRSSALFAPDSVKFKGTRFVWRTPDGGLLDVGPTVQGINIDTHAHWTHVAELFELVLGVWPDTALFDLQTGHVHDPASFRAFVASSYQEKAEWLARRAAEQAAGDASG
jgi:hypothetical protein